MRPARWVGVLALVVASTVLAVRSPAASAECSAAEVAELHNLLEDQANRTRTWNIAWGTVFAVAATAEFGMVAAEWSPLGDWNDDVRAGALAGGIKASIGVVSKLLLPLRSVPAPALTGDACVDLAAAETALTLAARRQRKALYVNTIGGLAINLTGVLALGLWADSWKQAALSFAIGAPVGLLSTFTMPRGAWSLHRARRPVVAAMPVVTPDYAGVLVGAAF